MKITILGAGKQGTNLAQALALGGHDITIVDKNPEIIDKLSSRLDIKCIAADAKDIDTLKTAKIQKNDLVISCTDKDDKNIVLSCLAKEIGAKRCFARVLSIEKISQIDLVKRVMGIDLILNPNFECANEIYKHLTNRYSFGEGYKMINGMALIEFDCQALSFIPGHALKECADSLNGLLVVALSRDGKLIIPNGNSVFEEDDHIYAVGPRDDVKAMRDKLHKYDNNEKLRRVMIAGGGKTCLFLSKQLIADDVNVTIIENNKDRAKYLASILDKAMVVYGDATDSDLLFEEEIDNMDAFIACTGVDEANYMLAMYAKQHGVEDSIAKITRGNYGPMLENLGDIMTINPIDICTARVLRHIKEDNNLVFSKLIQGQAEFLEISIEDNLPICGKLIKDIHIPTGVLLAALFRNGEMIVPRGTTKIEAGDRIVILAMLSQISVVQSLIKGYDSEGF